MYTGAVVSFLLLGDPSFAEAAEKALPSVVTIRAVRRVEEREVPEWIADIFGQLLEDEATSDLRRERSHGSGVVISRDGLLLTNHHLIEDAENIEIGTHDGDWLAAELVGSDPPSDLAVLRVAARRTLRPIALGSSKRLRVGDFVLAVGDPFAIGPSVSLGVVSAKGRTDVGIIADEDLIQTDAAINPGSSGGALLDQRGRLVGINTAIISRSGGSQGVAFAIPVEAAMSIAEALVRNGEVVRSWIGVSVQELDTPLRVFFGLGRRHGVLVTEVIDGGPALIGGVQCKDVIVTIGGRGVRTVGQFRNAVTASPPGIPVVVTIVRAGVERILKIVPAPRPSEPSRTAPKTSEPALGVDLVPLDDVARSLFAIPPSVTLGAVVVAVRAGGLGDIAGFEPGDVILELDGEAVTAAVELESTWREAHRPILARIIRRQQARYLVLPASPQSPAG